MDMDNEYNFILLGELVLENLFVTCKLVQKKKKKRKVLVVFQVFLYLTLHVISRKYKKNK